MGSAREGFLRKKGQGVWGMGQKRPGPARAWTRQSLEGRVSLQIPRLTITSGIENQTQQTRHQTSLLPAHPPFEDCSLPSVLGVSCVPQVVSSLQASAPAFPSAWNPFAPKRWKEMQNQSTKEAKNSPQDMCYHTHFTGNATEPREVKKRTRGHTAWQWRSQVFCLNSTSPKTPGEGFEDPATALMAGHGAGPSGS